TGDIFSVCFGSQIFVVINGYKLVKEALVKNAEFMSARPPVPQVEGSHLGTYFSPTEIGGGAKPEEVMEEKEEKAEA
ncbi:cytochrome p450 subfamily 2 j19b, partial [Plakobranchus ocellatus]